MKKATDPAASINFAPETDLLGIHLRFSTLMYAFSADLMNPKKLTPTLIGIVGG